MADRPGSGPDRSGSSDAPGFDWLYGKKDRAAGDQPGGPAGSTPGNQPGAPHPEATRVMPVQPRPSQGGGAERSRNQGGPTHGQGQQPPVPPRIAPTPGGPSGTGRPRRSRAKLVRRLVLLLLVAWIAYLVLVPIFAWKQVDKVAFEPSAAGRPGDQPGTTYLLVGSDSRAGLTAEQKKEYATGDVANDRGRTDTIMLLHTGSGPNLLMSIPRDSIVEVPGHGTTKVNAAFSLGGPRLLVKTIEHNTGIRIDSYAEIGLGGVVSLVDAVDGITICPEFDMKDPLAGINVKKGCQPADGRLALAYSRSRHSDPRYGDITRAKHQREVVSAVGKKVTSPWSVLNPLRYWKLNHAAPDSFAFGKGASPLSAAKWAWAMTRVNGSKGMTCGVPISDLAVHWDSERSKKMFGYIKRDETRSIPTSLCTPTGLPKSVTG